MPIKEAHTRPKAERRSKTFFNGKIAKSKSYRETEELISLVICDIVNGLTRSDIISKLKDGLYPDQRKPYKEPTANDYYYTALQRIKDDREEEISELEDKLYAQYYSLYADAVQADNTLIAKTILDSIAKTFLNKNDKNIKVETQNDGKVNISFNFGGD